MFVVSNNKHLQVSVITNGVSEIENLCGRQSRQAMRTRLCGGIPADLTFCYFLVKQKVEEEIFNQPTKIEEGDASATLSTRIELFYGVNQQRNKSIRYFNNSVENTHYYFGKYYEKEIVATTNATCSYDYIYGDNGVVALHTTTILPSTDTTGGGGDPRVVADGTYYIHTDHLGSYCALTDLNKKVVQRNYFDPWGNFKWVYKGRGDEFEMTDSLQRDTISMQPIATANFTVSSRGFTGHEHYPQFKIINMNGRLYDPVICRFFSPDKYVMNSSFTQDFNRYSYARNNPLMYTDPSGDHPILIATLVIGAAWCAIMGGIEGQKQGATGWKMAGYIAGGAAIGAISGMAGYGVSAGVATAGFGAVTGVVSGALSGLTSGVIGGIGMAIFAGKSPQEKYYSTLYGGLFGMGMGTFMGGISDISNAVRVKAVFSQIGKEHGFDTKQPIPRFLRNSKFVKYVKNGLYPYATDPSGGYQIVNGGTELTDGSGVVRAGSVIGEGVNGTFTGRSTMYLHQELAFTSLRKLYNVLGHELVHVSQYAALAGHPFNNSASFRSMLEHGATSFSNFLDLVYYSSTTFQSDWIQMFPNAYQVADYSTFWWTQYVYRPDGIKLPFKF